MELTKEQADMAYTAIEVAKATGKIKKGVNEVTKVLERGTAKFVAVAADANPKEITLHLPAIGSEKEIPVVTVPSKEELGAAAGLAVSTVAVAIIDLGDADIKSVTAQAPAPKEDTKQDSKEEAKEESKEEAKEESKEEAAAE